MEPRFKLLGLEPTTPLGEGFRLENGFKLHTLHLETGRHFTFIYSFNDEEAGGHKVVLGTKAIDAIIGAFYLHRYLVFDPSGNTFYEVARLADANTGSDPIEISLGEWTYEDFTELRLPAATVFDHSAFPTLD